MPNSRLLENTVVNWTLSDRRIRTSVAVGIEYGSSLARVVEILESSAGGHTGVARSEPVMVLLEDFGDDAIKFEVLFWVDFESEIALRKVRSDIRIAIEERCREAGIVIAFPQRDVHLDSSRPVEVRVVSKE